jgi:hypothetical protein
MKRFLFLFITVCSWTLSNAQSINDALKYATETLNGTARFNALSGAFGALGGDAAAMTINPAGSAVFMKSTGSASLSVVDKKNNSNFFNTTTKASETKLKFNQAGFVFVIDNIDQASSFNKFSFGINYLSTNNFDDDFFIAGTNTENSIDQFFLAQAQGVPLNLLELQSGESISSLYSYLGETEGVGAQNTFLGYQSFIIDPVDPQNPNNTAYFSNVGNGNYYQEYTAYSSGYSGKFTFNFATQINNRFSFGINLNSNNINHKQSTYLYESNNNPGGSVKKIGFENQLYTYGWGFSAQFGAIAKITDALRIGINYDTPVWYTMYDETIQYLETQRTIDDTAVNTFVDPRIVNVFYKYELRTPWKISGSAAYVFGKHGLISLDYNYKDYSVTQFSPTNDSAFFNENNKIKRELQGASSVKIGGEYRLDRLSLRGGYIFEESPYKNKTTVDNLTGFSAGLGVNLGNYSLDFSYSHTVQDRDQQLYSVGLTDAAAIEAINNNYTLSLIYELN